MGIFYCALLLHAAVMKRNRIVHTPVCQEAYAWTFICSKLDNETFLGNVSQIETSRCSK